MDQINILVTDDEREIADLLEIYLVSDGYRVLEGIQCKRRSSDFYRSMIFSWLF